MGILDLTQLPDTLSECDEFIAEMHQLVKIEGKLLLDVANSQSSTISKCVIKRAEIKKLMKISEALVNQVRGKLFRVYTENMDIQLSDRAKEKYVDSDSEFLDAYAINAEITERYDKLDGLCQALVARGFVIRNIVDIKLNALDYTQL
jgi:hypothetical protein